MSHHNVVGLHRESMGLASSPLRRKSMMNISAASEQSLPQNDDDAERMERRRNAEMEMRQREINTPDSEKRRSIGGSAISGLSASQLAEHYANCIKLSAENKINAKNAFSLQLIDYMAMMLKKRDSKMDNFQVASCTLDASTKIYAYRVDCVHTDVLKMAGGLAAGSRKKNAEGGGDDDGEGEESTLNDEDAPQVTRKKRTRKQKNTIATNIEQLNGKPDIDHAMDPFFLRSAGNMGDCQPGDCHFLTSLKILPSGGLILNSNIPYWEPEDDLASIERIDVPLPSLPDLNGRSICPIFEQFSFTKWSLDADDESVRAPSVLANHDDDFAFDVNAIPEPVPECENDAPVDNFEVSGIDDGLESDGEEARADGCAQLHKVSTAKIVDLRKHLSTAPSEYSYFREGALDLWAGPSHWKIRPMRSTTGARSEHGTTDGREVTQEGAANKKQKQKQKKELFVEFGKSEDISILSSESSNPVLKLAKRTIQKSWSAERNTHPPDIHFDTKQYCQLTLRKLIGISIDPDPVEDDEPRNYDYENDHDTSEYCPNVNMGDDLDDGDDGVGDDGFLPSQPQDVHSNFAVEGTSNMETFAGDNLVVPPNKVPKIFIPYAMRAKKVDMKKLKAAIWSILTDSDSHTEANPETLRVQIPVTFRELYSKLPYKLSSKMVENLSAPLTVVALLHLANEKVLHIVGQEDLSDMVISQL